MASLIAGCCCDTQEILDLWRPCDATEASLWDFTLPRSVYDDMPPGSTVIQINSMWLCYERVEEDVAGPVSEYTTITYQDDCEDVDCECEDSEACIGIVGYAARFFGDDVRFFSGIFGCVGPNNVENPLTEWDGTMPVKSGADECGWSTSGKTYGVDAPDDNRMWNIVATVNRVAGRWQLSITWTNATPLSATMTFIGPGGASPEGSYVYDGGADFDTAGCYEISPTTLTLEYC